MHKYSWCFQFKMIRYNLQVILFNYEFQDGALGRTPPPTILTMAGLRVAEEQPI